jgi:hypoxanthine-DNA glycosylase
MVLPVLPVHADLARCFAPIANSAARVLILGSVPGVASLKAGRYYAHPRNQFWPIMAALLDADLPAMDYPQRCQTLLDAGIALWDVLRSCRRPGSLDADIAPDSIIANDFGEFFRHQPGIDRVYFNGAAAQQHFMRHALPQLRTLDLPARQYLRLPSTSPAHAALDFQAKLRAWRVVLDSAPGQTRANSSRREANIEVAR